MKVELAETDQMTVEEFLAFTAARPEGERWELIEGVAVMSPSATQWHQTITGNVLEAPLNQKAARSAAWYPILGVGTRVPVSPNSLPQPGIYVQARPPADSHVTADALVIFEALSRSNKRADRAWRKRVHASIPNCQHYVTIAHETAEVTRYDREDGWNAHAVKGLKSELVLPAIDVTIPLSTIYRWTPIK